MTTRSPSSLTIRSGLSSGTVRYGHDPGTDPGLSLVLGSFVPRGQVARLLLGELVDLDAHRLQLQAGDLAVDLLRHWVDPPLELCCIPDRPLGREGLVCEGHVHHRARMALRRAEVHEPAVRDEVEPPPVLQRELLDKLPRL